MIKYDIRTVYRPSSSACVIMSLISSSDACCRNSFITVNSSELVMRPSLFLSNILNASRMSEHTRRDKHQSLDPLPSARQHPSYGNCLEVKREYYQNCFVLDCVTQCSQSAAHLCEQFLQVQQIWFVTLGP